MRRVIMHIDMDAFYASVEQLDRPELRGKPVIVGADPKTGRGVVSAASYEARRFGVHSAQPISQAVKACPDGIFLPPRFSRYKELSDMVFAILESVSPLVEPLSIDEAFVDLTGTERLQGDPVAVARSVKRRILDEIGLVASVGIAPNKFTAKIASDYGKPDGFIIVPENGVKKFLWPLPIERLWGVGPKTEKALNSLGIDTIGDLAAMPIERLRNRLGDHGESLWRLSHGKDERPVSDISDRKGISCETTYIEDVRDLSTNIATLRELSDRLTGRMRKKAIFGRTITVKIRYSDFTTITRAETLDHPLKTADEIYEEALRLAEPEIAGSIRLLGIRMSGLTGKEGEQLPLFDSEKHKKNIRFEQALDDIEKRYGKGAITRGTRLKGHPNDDV